MIQGTQLPYVCLFFCYVILSFSQNSLQEYGYQLCALSKIIYRYSYNYSEKKEREIIEYTN
ncbi:hypothetical protein AMTRI_Chr02g222980 [Amborella trichopoda]